MVYFLGYQDLDEIHQRMVIINDMDTELIRRINEDNTYFESKINRIYLKGISICLTMIFEKK